MFFLGEKVLQYLLTIKSCELVMLKFELKTE